VKPPRFEYAAPTTAAEALALLRDRGADAKILAGGQSLVPLLNFRLARPGLLIDMSRCTGLDAMFVDDRSGELVLGALVRQTDAERSALVRERWPLLAAAIRHVGHRAIRNRGTIGGSVAHADPAAELPLVLVALDGRVKAASHRGERLIAARDLFVSYLTTDLAPDELLLDVRFPASPPQAGWAFEEFSRRSGDFAIAAACALVTLANGRVSHAALAIAGGGATPMRASDAERMLVGGAGDDDAIERGASAAADGCEVDGDIHASAEYRRGLIKVLTARALRGAIARASGLSSGSVKR
jgi:CO/xanthine dehydrogenase FAD-binding subunit